ncbi:MAG: BMP family ABC transporter substrate-binding protein [Anaerolineales bacterium]|nr:MAG: BMP family ABC transporter substrate-binding protein [Anaerolineales bacterium]
MRKQLSFLVVLTVLLSALLSACGPAVVEGYTVGMVTDSGGINDQSFNATSWKGVAMAIDELGVEGSYLESQQQTDYATNITQFVNQGSNIIITVGYLLADDTATFATENPDIDFAIVDFAYDPPIDNIRGLIFNTDEAAILAGYAAAAASKTGKVATFGGINITPVTIFMVAFEQGVKLYNEKYGTSVEVLGWDTAANTGVFVGNFESSDDGRRVGEELLGEGADVIMAVAGPVGVGTAQAVKEHGNAWFIGVDTDWTVSAPEFTDVILTSVLKNMDIAIRDTIKQASSPDFKGFGGELYIGTLANDGVGLSAIAEGAVSDQVLKEIENIGKDVQGGKVDTGWLGYLDSLE